MPKTSSAPDVQVDPEVAIVASGDVDPRLIPPSELAMLRRRQCDPTHDRIDRLLDHAELLAEICAQLVEERDQNEHRALRLEGKCNAVAEAIGLPHGGGDAGYLVPNVEALVERAKGYEQIGAALLPIARSVATAVENLANPQMEVSADEAGSVVVQIGDRVIAQASGVNR